jgi:lipoyl(octanoyl) transferase
MEEFVVQGQYCKGPLSLAGDRLPMSPSPDPPPLEIFLLGMVDFREVQLLQRRIVYDLGEHGGACLLLCEHPPTISVGRAGSRSHIVPDDPTLGALGIQTHWVNRGGGCVLHLPGQLAAYVAMPLELANLTLWSYVDRLHRAIEGVLDEFELCGRARTDSPGVFLGKARVATVGVAVNRWIAYHGLTINVGPYLPMFDILNELGPEGPLQQTSIESQKQRSIPMPRVRESLIRHLEQALGLKRHHLFTSHPLICRKVLSHVYAPSSG